MNFSFTKYLLTTVALSMTTSYSSTTINQTPLGGGALDSNSQSSPVNQSYANSVCNNINTGTITDKLSNEQIQRRSDKEKEINEGIKKRVQHINDVTKEVSRYDEKISLSIINNILNNQVKSDGQSEKEIVYFEDSDTAVLSKELSRHIINLIIKNDITVNAENVRLFTVLMSNPEKSKKYALLINQILQISKEQYDKTPIEDKLPMVFDGLNIDQLFVNRENAVCNEMTKDIKHQFLLSFFKLYFDFAQGNPYKAESILQSMLDEKQTPIENWDQLYKYLFIFCDYIEESNLKYKINALNVSEEKRAEIRNQYTLEGMEKKKEYVIEQYNLARRDMRKWVDILPYVILIINAIDNNANSK